VLVLPEECFLEILDIIIYFVGAIVCYNDLYCFSYCIGRPWNGVEETLVLLAPCPWCEDVLRFTTDSFHFSVWTATGKVRTWSNGQDNVRTWSNGQDNVRTWSNGQDKVRTWSNGQDNVRTWSNGQDKVRTWSNGQDDSKSSLLAILNSEASFACTPYKQRCCGISTFHSLMCLNLWCNIFCKNDKR